MQQKQLYICNITGSYKEITAGFGNSIWTVNLKGDIYKKEGVNSLEPFGKDWEKISDVKFNSISSGLAGMFGISVNGNLLVYKGEMI